MRKQDYSILAAVIARNIALVNKYKTGEERAAGVRAAIAIAEEFAASASVNKSAFLKECGIK